MEADEGAEGDYIAPGREPFSWQFIFSATEYMKE